MKAIYKVPIIRGLRDLLAHESPKPYLEWYLAGLRDAGGIKSYVFRPFNDKLFSTKRHEFLVLELPDNMTLLPKGIENTLKDSYGARLP